MENQKLKMNNAKFVKIWSSVVAIVVVLAIVATVLMNFFSLSMEIYLGRGEAVYSTSEEMANADTNYYSAISSNINADADALAIAIAAEGITLFKNNGALPLAENDAVTPFGYRYVTPVYGGGGSGSVDTSSPRVVSAITALNKYFTVNSEMENLLTSSTARGMTPTEYEGPNERGGFSGATSNIIEFDSAIYSGHEASCAGSTAIIFIGRAGGEGGDLHGNFPASSLYNTTYIDGTEHILQLSEDEKTMIRYAKENCDKTVVILNTNNTMEIAELMADEGDLAVDAILWIGSPGAQGFEAMGQILCGKVNPSGKTVDTWPVDVMTNPANANFGNYEYDNLYLVAGGFPSPVGDATEMNFLEYEENIYIGYRYYETVHDTNGTFTVFGEDGKSYDEAVLIPFGYGLSYGATFTQEITSFTEDDTNIYLTVKTTNNGTETAKDVIQVYYNPPYTDLDIQMKIEKSTANLIAFDKTGDIKPGDSETVEITIAKEDMASYCYTRQNSDGTIGAYMLEEGDYIISVNKNSHEEYDSVTFQNGSTVWYDCDNIRASELLGQALLDDEGNSTGLPAAAEFDSTAEFVAASNRFQSMTDYMTTRTTQLTRASGTLVNTASAPTEAEMANVPAGYEYTVNEEGKMLLCHTDLSKNPVLGNGESSKVYVAEMPVVGAAGGLTVADMRGKSYFDPMWDELLNQLELTDHGLYVALAASYNQTAAIEAISKPATIDSDGPMGLNNWGIDYDFSAYPSEPIVAATFNVDLAYAWGDMVGQEAEVTGINHWYAPGMNIHRSAFSGRNFEYFSEDPLLSGYMAVAEISGAADRGLVTTMKHYALNDQENYDNDRSRVSIWCNEQAMREIYLKPFEMAVKYARATLKYVQEDGTTATKVIRGASGLMNCMNYWGTEWGGASYALNTEILRDEWGFQGFIVTDMVMNAGSNSVDQALRSGSDTWMAWGEAFTELIEDTESATGIAAIRRAVKNMCYAIANSRAMEGVAPGTVVTYKTSPWKIWLTVGDVLAAVFAVVMIFVMVKRTKHAKAHPELYASAKVKANQK